MEMSGQLNDPAAGLRKNRGTHWIGSWVGPIAGLGTVARRKTPSSCRENFRIRKRQGIYSPSERLLASQEGHCPMDFVCSG